MSTEERAAESETMRSYRLAFERVQALEVELARERSARADAERERDEARGTNTRLQRRVQAADAALAERGAGGPSLGRAAANYAALLATKERDEARQCAETEASLRRDALAKAAAAEAALATINEVAKANGERARLGDEMLAAERAARVKAEGERDSFRNGQEQQAHLFDLLWQDVHGPAGWCETAKRAEAALRGLLAVADGDHCACGDPGCTKTRDAWAAARAVAAPSPGEGERR
jgi:hypothetical protein